MAVCLRRKGEGRPSGGTRESIGSFPSLAQRRRGKKPRIVRVHRIERASEGDYRIRIARFKRIHVGENEIARAIAAEGLFVVLLHDGKGVEDIANIIAIRDAVEQEIKRIEPRAQMRAPLLVPFERASGCPGR